MAQMTRDEARWYLAGMFDGEGSASPQKDPKGNVQICKIRIASCDQELIDAVAGALEVLGIYYKVYRRKRDRDNPQWRPGMTVEVYRIAEVQKFMREIPFQHKRKRQVLDSWLADREAFPPYSFRKGRLVLRDAEGVVV